MVKIPNVYSSCIIYKYKKDMVMVYCVLEQVQQNYYNGLQVPSNLGEV